MALKKIPYRKVAALIADQLSTEEDKETLDLIRRLGRARDRRYLTPGELEAVCRWKSARALPHVRRNSAFRVRAATHPRWTPKTG